MLIYYKDAIGSVTRLAGGSSRADGHPVGPDSFSPDLSSSVDVVPCVNAPWAAVIPRANNVLRISFSAAISFSTAAQAEKFATYDVIRLGNGGELAVILDDGSRVIFTDVAWTSIRPSLRGLLVRTSYVLTVSPAPDYAASTAWAPTPSSGVDAIGLSWPIFFDATSYAVLRDGVILSGVTVSVEEGTASCSIPAADGASHDYAVQALDGDGTLLATSDAIAAAPAAPSAPVLSVTPSASAFELSWEAADGAASYALLADGEPTGNTYAADATSATYVPPAGVTTVVLVLRAISSVGLQADSAPVTATLATE